MITFEQFKAVVLQKLEAYDKDTNSLEDKNNPTQLDEASWWLDFLVHADVDVV